jgi:hypothetical protein
VKNSILLFKASQDADGRSGKTQEKLASVTILFSFAHPPTKKQFTINSSPFQTEEKMQKVVSGFAFCLFLFIGTALTPSLAAAQELSAIEQLKAAFDKEANSYARVELLNKVQSAMAASKRSEDMAALDAMLESALQDKSPIVVIEAIRLIGQFKREGFIDELDALREKVSKSPMATSRISIRCMIIRSLGLMPTAKSQGIFGKIITSQEGYETSQDLLETINAISNTRNKAFISTLSVYFSKIQSRQRDLDARLGNKNLKENERKSLEYRIMEYNQFAKNVENSIDNLVKNGR